MATLKDLIRAETLKVGSHGAMPSTQVIKLIEKRDFDCPTGTESFNYIAPCDGVLVAFLQAGSRDGNNQPGVNIVADNDIRYAIRTTDGSVQMQLRKGETSRADFYEAHQNVAQWIVRFVKTIGGGYKRYLKALSRNRFGGSLWLRLKTTSEWNKARSYLQTRSGLRLSLRPRLSVASTFNLKRLTVEPISLLQKLVGYISKPSQLTKVPTLTLFPSAKKRGCRVAAQQFKQANYLLHKLLCKREGCSTYGLKQSLPMLCTLFRQLVASNNARMEVAA